MITKYNKKNLYEEQIAQKINELKILCNAERIPMFIACAVANSDKQTVYQYDYVGTHPNNIELKDDKITKFINVVNGFDTVPPKKVIDLDFD